MGEKYGVRPSTLLGFGENNSQRFFFDLKVTSLVAERTQAAIEESKAEAAMGKTPVPSVSKTRTRVQQLTQIHGEAPDAENVRKLLAA